MLNPRNGVVKQRTRKHDDENDGRLGLSLNLSDLPRFNDSKPRRLPLYQLRNLSNYTQTGNPAIAFWMSWLIGSLMYFTGEIGDIILGLDTRLLVAGEMILPHYGSVTPAVRIRPMIIDSGLYELRIEMEQERDFGGLILQNRTSNFNEPIAILPGYYKKVAKERQALLKSMDIVGEDDRYQPESSREDENPKCRKVSWVKYLFPTCNRLHENGLSFGTVDQDNLVSYLSSGTSRDAFLYEMNGRISDKIVMKKMKIKRPLGARQISDVRKEALIMERLSSSPHVLDIYGHCGITVLVEAMVSDLVEDIVPGTGIASQKELDALDRVLPRNNFTAFEKLQIAMDMALSLADLHGFEGGPISHADTHIEQWLRASDGSVKLNDFNNAFEPKWDEKKQEYCDRTGIYGDVYRSPEEYSNEPQNESVDVFAFGNNIYTLITGLWPHYDADAQRIPHAKTREHIIAGKLPYVDSRYRERSFIEGRLAEIMERCWAFDRINRPSIFEIVSFLQDTMRKATNVVEMKASDHINTTVHRHRNPQALPADAVN